MKTLIENRIICVVDDDGAVRDALRIQLRMHGFRVETFDSAAAFLEAPPSASGCVIVDVRMPDMDGLELQREISRRGLNLPVIVMTGHGDVPLAVKAMKAGAVDFLEKPFEEGALLASIRAGLELHASSEQKAEKNNQASKLIESLTARERDVLAQLVEGHQNKVVAHNLGISPRTVEIYRARVMGKMGARSIAQLVRMTMSGKL